MEIILAIVVASAVIFFGVLISLGNERQKKAIDNLREQIILWAMQDLQIKREGLVCEVKVDDPLEWLSRLFRKLSNSNERLQIIEAFDEPRALICVTGNKETKVLFSTLSPNQIMNVKKEKVNRLSNYSRTNPLLSLPSKVAGHEISVLNSNFLFDLELQIAWKGLTGQDIGAEERLWMYII